MKTLYVMDPLRSLHLEGDSTYMMMLEANRRGWPTYWCTPKDLFAVGGRSYSKATYVKVTETEPFFDEAEPQDIDLGSFDVIWMRKDPPFNMDYIFSTYMCTRERNRTGAYIIHSRLANPPPYAR